MYVKHKASAAMIVASIGVSTLMTAGLASANPCQGDKSQNCQSTSAAPTPAPAQTHQSTPPQTETHESTPAPSAPPSKAPESSAPQTSAPQTTAPSQHGRESKPSETPAATTTAPETTPGRDEHGRESKPSESPSTTAAPSTSERNHPKPPPFTPAGQFERGNAQVGGPTDLPRGFNTPGHGAPPPPPQRSPGWNDGSAPGGPPPNWEGPPPAGGWDAPQPPPGGWNRRYDHPGPPRDVARARDDFGYFEYNGFSAVPTFNPWYGGWGYWYFGVWIPLY